MKLWATKNSTSKYADVYVSTKKPDVEMHDNKPFGPYYSIVGGGKSMELCNQGWLRMTGIRLKAGVPTKITLTKGK